MPSDGLREGADVAQRLNEIPMPRLFRPMLAAVLCAMLGFTPSVVGAVVPLFDGQTLQGWKGAPGESWRIEDGTIAAGSISAVQDHYAYLISTAEAENFEVSLEYKFEGTAHLNSGFYFRSEALPGGKISGYQADMGEGYDGGIYEEGRGRGMIATAPTEKVGRIVNQGGWNRMRVRAEGRRIRTWLNDEAITDYTERKDGIPHRGVFALELMSGLKGIVRFRNLTLQRLPDSPAEEWNARLADGPATRLADRLDSGGPYAPYRKGRFSFITNEVVVMAGPENVVTEQRTGWLETSLASGFRNENPRFRPMGWEGDTVYRQNRMMNWGSWKENLDAVGATTVFAWFGQLEALDNSNSVTGFEAAYRGLLGEFAQRTPRIVIISPLPFERPVDSRVVDNTWRNNVVRQHAEVARKLAEEHQWVYVDLLTPILHRKPSLPPLTRDGMHLTPEGMHEVAAMIAADLKIARSKTGLESLRMAIVEKNRLWFDTWRPMNWAFAYGDRTTQPFAQPVNGQPSLVEAFANLKGVMAHGDAVVQAIALGQPSPSNPPAEPPRADPPAPTPEEEMSRFQIREGYAVSLFASEQLGVVRPLQIRWDELGRLWVLCAPSYPQLQAGEKAGDYLIMLEDTTGSGRADKVTRVAEGLTMPMGFEFGDGGIYICDNTQLIHLRDTTGNGVMNERRVVLSGFGTGDTHQTINSVRWGADGALWFTQGYHIWSSIETPYGIVDLNRSGLWRLNPRTLKLDSFLNESTAGLNCWGVIFDDFGQVFHGSGADFAIWHTSPALVPTLHPLSLGAGLATSKGKSMEPEFLGSSHLPPDMQGVLMKSVYYTSQVRLYRLRDEGAGFVSEDLGDLIASQGNEFRPVESRVGPDGAIYVCDWLNPVIGHYQASYRDPRRDHSHGRIWRITAKGRDLLKRPALERMNAVELAGQLRSPERWVRDQAKYSLYRKPKPEAVRAVDELLATEAGVTPASAQLLYELSGVFAAHEEPRVAIIQKLLSNGDFRWRAWGTHLVGVWASKIPNSLEILAKSAADTHPRVRMEAVVAASYVKRPESVKVASIVLDYPMDPSVDYALTQCIHELAPIWQPALKSGQLDFGARYGAMARVLGTLGGVNVVAQVRDLLQSGHATGATKEGLLAVLVEHGGPVDVAFALQSAPGSSLVLDALVSSAFGKRDPGYKVVLEQLLASPNQAARIAGCRVAGIWGQDYGLLDRIEVLASDSSANPTERAAAVVAIGRIKGRDALPTLRPYLVSNESALRVAALEALAPLDPQGVARRSVELLSQAVKVDDAGALLRPLLERKDGPGLIAAAIHDTKLPAESARLALQWLGKSGRDDHELLAALRDAAGQSSGRPGYSAALVAELVADARKRGDARRGNELVHSGDMACLGCHRINNEGGVTEGPALAPDLSAIGRAMTPDLIVEAVFWPKRQVKEGFLLTQLTTRDGRQLQGYKSAETTAELRLRQIDGTETVIQKKDIQDRNDAGTLMPDGLLDPLLPGQRLDVLRYLMELGR